MESLIHQGMIVVTHSSYSLMSRGRLVFELPDPSRVSITDLANWLYASSIPKEEDIHNVDDFFVGETMEEDSPFQQQFVPPSQDLTQQSIGSFTLDQDRWMWMKAELENLRA